ncbi:MAG: isocitrate dehydrogenase, partial [Candidatus Altiarchaeales archaeon ex4484_96]
MKKITVIPGDGIGPEVVDATLKIIDASGARLDYEYAEAGQGVMEKDGTPLPDYVIEAVKRNKIALKGPITTPVGSGFRSVNVALRKKLELYANLRPARSLKGISSRYDDVDLVVVRENLEGLYIGDEKYLNEEKTEAQAIRLITRAGSERVYKYAFDYAMREGRHKVTAVHKANILKYTDGIFLDAGRKISKDYPGIEFEDRIIDNMCMQLVKKPRLYD